MAALDLDRWFTGQHLTDHFGTAAREAAEVDRSRAALHEMGHTAEQAARALGYAWEHQARAERRPGH